MPCAVIPITSWARNEPTQSWRFKMVLSDSAEVMETVAKKRFLRKSPFLEFCDAEGLSVITGYGVEDLRTVPLSHWERLGGPAAYCHLEGSQGFVGSMVAEIPPGKNLKPPQARCPKRSYSGDSSSSGRRQLPGDLQREVRADETGNRRFHQHGATALRVWISEFSARAGNLHFKYD